jgi:hypothetical protein
MTIKSTFARSLTILLAVALVFTAGFAVNRTDALSNVMERYTNAEAEAWTVNNSGSLTVSSPKHYKYSPSYKKLHTFETKVNTIKAKTNVRQAITLKTKLFLPPTNKKSGDFGNPQSMAFDSTGKYLYELISNGDGTNKGRIVRYDYPSLLKAGLGAGKGLPELRRAFSYRQQNILKPDQKKLLSKVKIKIGPLFNIGHGQSLAYNLKTNELWMSKDEQAKGGGWKSGYDATVQRIDPNSLKPNKSISFRMQANETGGKIMEPHNLTFDADGHGYWAANGDGGSMRIYQLDIDGSSVSAKYVQQIKNGINKGVKNHIQSTGYNAANNRLYVVADDTIWSMPVDKLGSLKSDDLAYTKFASQREFESFIFDAQGYGYLLTNLGPEVLKSTAPLT